MTPNHPNYTRVEQVSSQPPNPNPVKASVQYQGLQHYQHRDFVNSVTKKLEV